MNEQGRGNDDNGQREVRTCEEMESHAMGLDEQKADSTPKGWMYSLCVDAERVQTDAVCMYIHLCVFSHVCVCVCVSVKCEREIFVSQIYKLRLSPQVSRCDGQC